MAEPTPNVTPQTGAIHVTVSGVTPNEPATLIATAVGGGAVSKTVPLNSGPSGKVNVVIPLAAGTYDIEIKPGDGTKGSWTYAGVVVP